MAYTQQTLDRKINPKRGTIYDSTGKTILAISATVETITVNPINISKADKEKVARALTDIFDLDYNTVLKRETKRRSEAELPLYRMGARYGCSYSILWVN